ncbi:MAG TPA: cupin domain-containing protein [Pyrinomonadaceae bacterium]|nr:cupin domain-containing protein [Pyrinomonadaceae bacterium]
MSAGTMSFDVEYWNNAATPDARRLRRQLELEGYTVFEWTDRPGTTYPPHEHAEDQSHWVLSGALTLVVGGEEYTLSAGDRDYMSAGTVHEARVEGAEPVVYLVGAKY